MRGPRTVMKSDPRSPQLEKALAQKQKTQHSQKGKKEKETNTLSALFKKNKKNKKLPHR